jgi:hypothetical protein
LRRGGDLVNRVGPWAGPCTIGVVEPPQDDVEPTDEELLEIEDFDVADDDEDDDSRD